MMRLRMSVLMFVQYFAWGAWLVPLGTYMDQGLGFSAEIGTAYGLIGIATILSTLLIGMAADRYLAAETLLALLALGAGLSLLWVSTITRSPSLFLGGLLVHYLFYASTIPLANVVVFGALDRVETEFPLIRLWGTVGWIVAGIIVGTLAGAARTAFPMRMAGCVYVALAFYALTLPSTPPRAAPRNRGLVSLLGLDVVLTQRRPSFWIFIACTLVLMIPKSFYDNLGNAFFAAKGLEVTLFGWTFEATAVQTAGQMFELLFLLSLPLLLLRLGIKWVMVAGMAAWAVRFALFAFGFDANGAAMPLLLLGIVIHGVCYDFLIVAGQIYVDTQFDESARSRAQAFYALVTQGIGIVVGSVVAGAVFNVFTDADGHNWRSTWLVAAGIAAAAATVFAAAFRTRAANNG